MDIGEIRQLLIVHKEKVALIGMALFFILLVGGGLYLQQSRQKEEVVVEHPPEKVTFRKSTSGKGGKESDNAKEKTEGARSPSGTYFLKPSPDELLDQIADMSELKPAVVEGKYVQMPVLWPVYFFSFEQGREGGRGRLMCDVSEDGFGVVVESVVPLAQFPELANFTAGQRIWIGGKIQAIDNSGTGTIYLETEYLSSKNPVPEQVARQGSAKADS